MNMILPYLDRYFFIQLMLKQHGAFKEMENPKPDSLVWVEFPRKLIKEIEDKVKQTEDCINAMKN